MGAKLASLSGVTGATQDRGLSLIAVSAFSAASTVSLDNVFTSQFENYKVVITATNSGAVACRLRMRAAGADDSSANYGTQYTQASNSTNAAARESAQTSGFIFQPLTQGAAAYIDFYLPALAVITRATSLVNWGTTSVEIFSHAVVHNVATAYDGFTLYPASGTTTGTLRVYGYRAA